MVPPKRSLGGSNERAVRGRELIYFFSPRKAAHGTRNFFSYHIFVHGSKCQFIDGINLNLTHVCVCVVR